MAGNAGRRDGNAGKMIFFYGGCFIAELDIVELKVKGLVSKNNECLLLLPKIISVLRFSLDLFIDKTTSELSTISLDTVFSENNVRKKKKKE